MSFDLDRWADGIVGKLLDLDNAPRSNPYQCHDVFLSLLYALGGKPGDGHAPGTEYTDQVWRSFPTHRPNLARLFQKLGPSQIRRGDVVFWYSYAGVGGLPHVAVALADATPQTVFCVTQNPGQVKLAHLTRAGVLGVLRPLALFETARKADNDMMKLAWDTSGTGYLVTASGWAGLPNMQYYTLFQRLIRSNQGVAQPETFNRLEVDMMNSYQKLIERAANTGIAIDDKKLLAAIGDAIGKADLTFDAEIDEAKLAKVMNDVVVPRVTAAILKQAGQKLAS